MGIGFYRKKIVCDQKIVFVDWGDHILARFDVTVLYMIFLCMFTVKISQKDVFHPCEAHILARYGDVHIFLGFEKYQVLTQNSEGLSSVLPKNICS
jgi:hypothetical protein